MNAFVRLLGGKLQTRKIRQCINYFLLWNITVTGSEAGSVADSHGFNCPPHLFSYIYK